MAPKPAGTPVDSTNNDAENALLAKVEQDFKKANEAQCKVGCKCVKDKNATPQHGAYDVPVATTYAAPDGKIFRAQGTVSIKTTDTPGQCFDRSGVCGHFSRFRSGNLCHESGQRDDAAS